MDKELWIVTGIVVLSNIITSGILLYYGNIVTAIMFIVLAITEIAGAVYYHYI